MSTNTPAAHRRHTPASSSEPPAARPLPGVIAGLNALAAGSAHVRGTLLGPVAHGDDWFHLPRYLFLGENAHEDPWRLSIYAAFDGADDRAARAVAHTLERFALEPRLGEGFNLAFYPLPNPSGAADRTAATRAGHHLGQENWPRSEAPEIHWLARDARALQSHGVFLIRTTPRAEFTGWLRGLSPGDPFLHAEPMRGRSRSGCLPYIFPIQWETHPEGDDAAAGPLSLAADLRARPFEVTLNVPAGNSPEWAAQAVSNTLRAFVHNYRSAALNGLHI